MRNAQHAGASGVILANSICDCGDWKCINYFGSVICEAVFQELVDDASASDVSIPSVLIDRIDAKAIKDLLINNETVLAEMEWSTGTLPGQRVEYELWMTPDDVRSKSLLAEFKTVAQALGDRAVFTPHFRILDGNVLGCTKDQGQKCHKLCTSSGRYCSPPLSSARAVGISGSDLAKESLRRLCIWKIYGSSNGIGKEWWDYVYHFNNRCGLSKFFSDPQCLSNALLKARVDQNKLNRCMVDHKTELYDSQIETQLSSGVVTIPTAMVNGAKVSGSLTPGRFFDAICDSFAPSEMPSPCIVCTGMPNPVPCLARGRRDEVKEETSWHFSNVVSVAFVFILVGIGFFGMRWHEWRGEADTRNQSGHEGATYSLVGSDADDDQDIGAIQNEVEDISEHLTEGGSLDN